MGSIKSLKALLGITILILTLWGSQVEANKRFFGNSAREKRYAPDYDENDEGSELERRSASSSQQVQKPSDKYEFPQFPDDEFEQSQNGNQNPVDQQNAGESSETQNQNQNENQVGQSQFPEFPQEDKSDNYGQSQSQNQVETEVITENPYGSKGGYVQPKYPKEGRENKYDEKEQEEKPTSWYQKPWKFLKKHYNNLKETIRSGRGDYYVYP